MFGLIPTPMKPLLLLLPAVFLLPAICAAAHIDGITEDGKDAPPLLRVAVESGDLVAVIKTTGKQHGEGDATEHVPLLKGLGTDAVKVEVRVEEGKLKISANGEEKVSRNLSF